MTVNAENWGVMKNLFVRTERSDTCNITVNKKPGLSIRIKSLEAEAA